MEKYKVKVEFKGRTSKPTDADMKKSVATIKNMKHQELTINEIAKEFENGKCIYLTEFKELGDVSISNVKESYFFGIDIDNDIKGQPLPKSNQIKMENFIQNIQNDFGFTPIMAYYTFSKTKDWERFRLIFKFESPVSSKEYKRVFNAFLKQYNEKAFYEVIDTQAGNINRFWVGTDKKVHVNDSYIAISKEFVDSLANEDEKAKNEKAQKEYKFEDNSEKMFDDGSRNGSLQKYLSGKINNKDFRDYDTLLALALNVNRTRCNPPIEDEAEVKRIVDSVYKNLANGTYDVEEKTNTNTPPTTVEPTQQDLADIINKNNASLLYKNLINKTENLQKAGGLKKISTGFKHLDSKIGGGLYSGLYVIGAGSSIGKTTFVQQVTDYIASQGRHVLFFTLEMGNEEMLSKTIIRETFRLDRKFDLGSRDYLNGYFNDIELKQLQNSSEVVENIFKNITYIEGTFETTIKDIVNISNAFKNSIGSSPVIVIDYLQVINPIDVRMPDKQNVDRNIAELKRLSRNLDTPVIAISSVNRQNYYSYIDFSSFKESGSIEYGADVVIGLQLSVIHKIVNDTKDTDVSAKRELFNAAKKASPRGIEALVLKNRYGQTGNTHMYQYYPKFNLFEEMEDTPDVLKKQQELELAIGLPMKEEEVNLFANINK